MFLLYILNKNLHLFDELWSAVTVLNTHTIKSIHIDGLVQDCTYCSLALNHRYVYILMWCLAILENQVG